VPNYAMNSNGLAKRYDKLSPREPVPLLVAADACGDEAEFARLRSSAPREFLRVFDHADLKP
jgi:hypothetical protein